LSRLSASALASSSAYYAIEERLEPRIHSGCFSYLSSPIVELAIGSGETQTTISTHQGLIQAPYFQGEVDRFTADAPRSIELPNYDIDACAAVLEYIYEGDYFPTVSGNTMEYDPTIPSPEDHSVLTLIKDKVTVFKAQLRNLTMRSL
jgi:hypothetical protein